ncbi:hypothetical protein KCU29_004624 [Vibrio parahaemolyticus]|nr:hypothetical protein [Vibrio parahaemolyticus]
MSIKCGDYKVGDKLGGSILSRPIGQTKNVAVGTNEQGTVIYSVEDESQIIDYSKNCLALNDLLNLVPITADENSKRKIRQEIGHAFFNACTNDGSVENSEDFFTSVRRKIDILSAHTMEQMYNTLIVFNLIFSVVIILAITSLYISTIDENVKLASICMGSGVVGACLSLLQRNRDIDLSLFCTNAQLGRSALLSALLGAVIGVVVFIITKTNLYSTTINGGMYLSIFLSISSGFSERGFNSLMKKVKT